MAAKVLPPRNRRVFESVFGTSNISLPTPYATPATDFTVPGQAWGGPPPNILDEKLRTSSQSHQRLRSSVSNDHVEDQVKWDRAWHAVTHAFSIPKIHEGLELEELRLGTSKLDDKFSTALKQVVRPDIYLPQARQTEDVVVWYTAQVRHDFLHEVLPLISNLTVQYEGEILLSRCLKILGLAKWQYPHSMRLITQTIEILSSKELGAETYTKFKRDLNAMIGEAVMGILGGTLSDVLRKRIKLALDFASATGLNRTTGLPQPNPKQEDWEDVLGSVQTLKNTGLAGEKFQVIFAELMNDLMREWIYLSYKGVWNSQTVWNEPPSVEQRDKIYSVLPRSANHIAPSYSVINLCEWIEDLYAKLIVQVFGVLGIRGAVSLADLEKYKELAIGRLADLRIDELFDIVAGGDAVKGALDDLRTAITTPQKRLQLTENFARALRERLLHPGTSTLRILQTYISMIRSFHQLDHSKVLLDRVAYPLQNYLFSREDTVPIIIEGLLSDTDNIVGPLDDPNHNKLYALAHILKMEDSNSGTLDEELDWHDMEWTPDPVDAGPGYKRSKTVDVIGTMIGVLGTQDVFIKEFQRIIGENLLRNNQQEKEPFAREIAVLDLLKTRFGEPPLQACEVMLKDIHDSSKITQQIRGKLQHQASARTTAPQIQDPALDTKILSRFFWPSTVMDEERFTVPSVVHVHQKEYEAAYEEQKSKRKLTWLNALGKAEVELVLQDRTIKEECPTWMASVIYAFSGDGVTKTAEELEESLEMDEDLVASALVFWVSKQVLVESSPGTYTVLETLTSCKQPSNNQESSSSAIGTSFPTSADPGPSRAKAKDKGIYGEKSPIYWSFVKGMLTNSKSQMPIMQIGMMLKMMIPGGFPYGNEELGEWLGDKVQSGELEVEKGKFRLKK